MTKRNNDLNNGLSARAYLTAAALVVSAGLVIVIAYQVLTAANQSMDETFYAFAAMSFALVWILTERLLKRSVYGVTLTVGWQDRLTFAISMGFAFSIHMIHGVNGTWAVASQLIGGWVIFSCGAILLCLVWAGIKASLPSGKIKPQPKS